MLSTIGATSQPNEQLSGVIGGGESSILIQTNNNMEGEMTLSEKVEKTI
jgi:hypothetical protein